MFTRRFPAWASLAAAATFAITSCGSDPGDSTADAREWTGYTYINAGMQLDEITELAESRIADATGNLVSIDMHPGGSLGIDATTIADAVGSNSVQFADDGFFYGSVPIAGLLMLPMLYQSPEEVEEAISLAEPALQERMGELGVELLGHYLYPDQMFFTNVPVTSLADFEGLSIRTSSPQQQALVEAMGAQPVTISPAEVSTALQQGVVDGVMTAASGGGRLWKDSLTHAYTLPATPFVSFQEVNKSEFAQLPDEYQEVLREEVRSFGEEMTARMAEEEAVVLEQLEQEGMVVTDPSPEDIETATDLVRDYWDQWASEEGPEAEKLLDQFKERQG